MSAVPLDVPADGAAPEGDSHAGFRIGAKGARSCVAVVRRGRQPAAVRGKVTGVRWEQADRAAAMAEQPGNMAGLRDAAIVAVASDALLRVSEVAALDVSDVNLAEQTVLIRHSKHPEHYHPAGQGRRGGRPG